MNSIHEVKSWYKWISLSGLLMQQRLPLSMGVLSSSVIPAMYAQYFAKSNMNPGFYRMLFNQPPVK